MTIKEIPLIINGEKVRSKTDTWLDVLNPATQEVVAKVPMATKEEVDAVLNWIDDGTPDIVEIRSKVLQVNKLSEAIRSTKENMLANGIPPATKDSDIKTTKSQTVVTDDKGK